MKARLCCTKRKLEDLQLFGLTHAKDLKGRNRGGLPLPVLPLPVGSGGVRGEGHAQRLMGIAEKK